VTDELVRCERRGRAAWLTLDSPANRNALSPPLVARLTHGLRGAMADPAVRVVVLTGHGPAFCAGADLKDRPASARERGGRAHPFIEVLRLMVDGPKPVIAAVNGPAYGGGLGLVAAADIAIAADTAHFAFSEVRVGMVPAMISVVVLPKLGPHHAMRLFLTGARFDAASAASWNLVHRVVPPAALATAVEEEIEALALGGPVAVAVAKRLVRTVGRLSADEAFAWAEQTLEEVLASPEAAEGRAAFAARRRPRWAE
jgi:methylglutaconyl-CoA hydratase